MDALIPSTWGDWLRLALELLGLAAGLAALARDRPSPAEPEVVTLTKAE